VESLRYDVQFKPRAVRDIERLPSRIQAGPVKRLTDFTPEYRLRVGDYRVLFEVEKETIVIYRIRHRRQVYR
jgi:mRNA interferase RelE/StbE